MEIKEMTATGGRERSGEFNSYTGTAELYFAFSGAWYFVCGRSWSMQAITLTKIPKCFVFPVP